MSAKRTTIKTTVSVASIVDYAARWQIDLADAENVNPHGPVHGHIAVCLGEKASGADALGSPIHFQLTVHKLPSGDVSRALKRLQGKGDVLFLLVAHAAKYKPEIKNPKSQTGGSK